MTINPERGEIGLTLDGVEYGMRPDYATIVAIEEKTGRAIVNLADAARSLELPLATAATIVTLLIRSFGKATQDMVAANVAEARIAELLYDAGVPKVQLRLAIVLAAAATGGYTPLGEAKAAGTTTTDGQSTAA